MPARSVCLVTLSLSEAGPGRFGGQVSVTDIYHAALNTESSGNKRNRPVLRNCFGGGKLTNHCRRRSCLCTIPYRRGPSRSRPLVHLHRPLPYHTIPYQEASLDHRHPAACMWARPPGHTANCPRLARPAARRRLAARHMTTVRCTVRHGRFIATHLPCGAHLAKMFNLMFL